jgi:hypothetical protein
MKTSFHAVWMAGALSCLVPATASAQIKWTLTGDEAPSAQPWTQPSSINWVDSTDDGEDRFAVDGALKVSGSFNYTTGWFARGLAHVSDQSTKEQEAYSLQLGLTMDHFLGGHFDENQERVGALSLYSDIYFSWNSKAKFATPDDPVCLTASANPVCRTQHQQSARIALDLQPFLSGWEAVYTTVKETDALGHVTTRTTDDWAYSFAPQLIVFHDEVTEATVNAQGLREDGGVGGAKLILSLAVSPPMLEHRLVFRTSFQQLQTFYRSSARSDVFDRSSSLARVSVDYEFGARSWDTEGGWTPSIALAYSSGEDPLEGRKDKDDISIAFRLTYRNP